MKAVLAGGAGFIGRALWPHFRRAGYEIIVLSRREHAREEGVRFVVWDGRTVGPWARELEGGRICFSTWRDAV